MKVTEEITLSEVEKLRLWKPTRIVLVKFPNQKAAMDWYNSEEYKPYKKIWFNTSTSSILMVKGIKWKLKEVSIYI